MSEYSFTHVLKCSSFLVPVTVCCMNQHVDTLFKISNENKTDKYLRSYNLTPVFICIGFQCSFVFIPGFQSIVEEFVIKQVQLAVDYFECFRIHFNLFSFCSHSVGAPSTILRQIVCRSSDKKVFV